MNKITPLALLVTGGLATQAGATVQTFNLSPSDEGTPITIGGAASAQYSYRVGIKPPPLNSPAYYLDSAQPTSYFTTLSNASDMPNRNSSFYQGAYKAQSDSAFVGLKFKIDTQTFYGVARFTGPAAPADAAGLGDAVNFATDPNAPRLGEIDYQLAGDVPEPESWVLLIAGMGAAGVAMRRARRRSTLVTA